jgi:uncharacterized protein
MLTTVEISASGSTYRRGKSVQTTGTTSKRTLMRTIRLIWLLCIAVLPFAAQAQSFDCRAAGRSDERAICANEDLSELDIQMSNAYFRLLNSLSESAHAQLHSEQAEWLSERQECGSNLRCLRSKYQERIKELVIYQERINELIMVGTGEPTSSQGPACCLRVTRRS